MSSKIKKTNKQKTTVESEGHAGHNTWKKCNFNILIVFMWKEVDATDKDQRKLLL